MLVEDEWAVRYIADCGGGVPPSSLPPELETMSALSEDGSRDDLSDVEIDEDLDQKLREEVEKELPLSITDIEKAERTTGICCPILHSSSHEFCNDEAHSILSSLLSQ